MSPSSVPLGRQILRGFSQCAFQANEITAVFLIAAVLLFNWRMGVAYLVAVSIGTITAKALHGVPDLLDLGLYGFNSGLMGLAITNFFEPSPATWISVVGMAAVVAAVTVGMSRSLSFPFLAAPFILMFWILWPIAGTVGLQKIDLGAFPNAPVAIIEATVVGLSATLFSPSIVAGSLFLCGLALANWRHAIVALMGAAMASTLAALVGAPGTAINSGFIGFNAVLAAIATYVIVGSDLRYAALAALLSTWVFAYIGRHAPAPALASGFVLTVWILLLAGRFNPYFNGEASRTQTGAARAQLT